MDFCFSRFEKRTQEAAKLKVEVEKAQETITAAETLVGKLEGEFKRWSAQVLELTNVTEQLPSRAQLAAGFITYLGCQPEDMRRKYLKKWCSIVDIEDFDLKKFLSTESEQLVWKGEGLPSDELSMENALVILKVRSINHSKILLVVDFHKLSRLAIAIYKVYCLFNINLIP